MPRLLPQLDLDRCPHCSVAKPLLNERVGFETNDYAGQQKRFWRIYTCSRCGGVVTAAANGQDTEVVEIYPRAVSLSEIIPEPARTYLMQAIDSLHSPAGSVMLSAASIDAMLKAKSFKEGNLYSRIENASTAHLITPEMAKWAHEVRLDANEQRHADDNAPLPNYDDARRAIDFALALAEFLFVLPSRVTRGIQDASSAIKSVE